MTRSKAFYVASVLVIVAAIVGFATYHHMKPVMGSLEQQALAAPAKPSVQAKPAAPKETPAEKAVRAAAGKNRYAFVTFYKKGDAASNKMLATAKAIQGKLASRADFVTVAVGDTTNQPLVKRFAVDRAPIPVALVVAPNGAVTAAYQKEITAAAVSEAFVSDGQAAVLKALQSGKLALVCLRNGKTKYNKESMTAAEGMKADKTLTGVVGIIEIDPSNKAESKFLQLCKVNTASANSQVLMIIPPGKVLGTFDGNTTKDKLMASLRSAMASCGTGCGPSGCGPR
jgi:hypothetical protein